jgi:hypothetical protein
MLHNSTLSDARSEFKFRVFAFFDARSEFKFRVFAFFDAGFWKLLQPKRHNVENACFC